MLRRRSSRGFTLVELLVVMAIISMLVGLLMPAVQKVRESANRTTCANNLKQIAMACHLYEGAYHFLPPGRNHTQGASWAVLILPNLEQENLYKHWELGKTFYDQNETARLTNVPTYFCPSRRDVQTEDSLTGDVPSTNPAAPHVPGALCDYAANIGQLAH